jgi:hypothetical protein
MRSLIVKIALGCAAVLGVLCVVVAMQPAEFAVVRRTTIAAPPAVVFAQLNDFRKWQAWSPWEKMDPNLQRTYSGPAAGVGSTYAWQGNGAVGAGRMIITASTPGEHVGLTLEFAAPMVATNAIDFTLAETPGGVDVSWAMAGRNGFLGKAITMVVGMDAMVGSQFEQGLADLKSVAEAAA